MDIYSNPQLYDSIHSNYKWDYKLIEYFAKKYEGPVLELASGTGRLATPILKLRLNYTGLERSEIFLKEAKKNFKKKANFILGDMRNFHLGLSFDFIFIGFNSFLHNLSTKEAKSCLKCVLNHLNPKGKFLLSIFIPNTEFLYRNVKKLYPATDFFEFENSKCRILESNDYNFDDGLVCVRVDFFSKISREKDYRITYNVERRLFQYWNLQEF